jgi:sulfatase maturation enzyme AslB (radical SAM superfamily)
MHFWPNGDAFPCCISDSSQPIGNTTTSSIAEIWNGINLRKIRRDMLQENTSPACQRCYDLEAGGISTLRQHSNNNFAHHRDRVLTTHKDGTVPEVSMAYLDVRFSNICNLRCRTCSHDLSSSWYDDTVSLDPGYDKPRIMNINRTGDFWTQLVPYLEQTEEVYFAGGESLLTEEHYKILDHWISTGHTDVRLRYTTNFTKLDYKQRNIFELWRHFKDVRVAASLDASHDKSEYLRKNTVWSQIVENRRRMQAEVPDIYFEITPTVSLMNILHLPDFHKEWTELGLLDINNVRLNVLTWPAHSSIKVLPQSLKNTAQLRLVQHIGWMTQNKAASRSIDSWRSIISFMNTGDDSHLLPEFNSYNKRIDALKSEDFYSVFPELTEVKHV